MRIGYEKILHDSFRAISETEHSSLKRFEDAGITMDSSQEIEGLLKKGKQAKGGRLLSLMLGETRMAGKAANKDYNWIAPPPTTIPCIHLASEHDQYDDMQGISQAKASFPSVSAVDDLR